MARRGRRGGDGGGERGFSALESDPSDAFDVVGDADRRVFGPTAREGGVDARGD